MESLFLLFMVLGLGGLLNGDSDTSTPSDGSGQADAEFNTIEGDESADVLQGTASNDAIYAESGQDIVFGDSGDDKLYGGDDADFLLGGPGDDTLYFGAGKNQYDDLIFVPSDVINDDEQERLLSEAFIGDDVHFGGNDLDVLVDIDGADTIFGHQGPDGIAAVEGPDAENPASDIVYGGYGRDGFFLDNGDTVYGGANADIVETDPEFVQSDHIVWEDFNPGEGDQFNYDVSGADPRDAFPSELQTTSDGTMLVVDGVEVVLFRGNFDVPGSAVQIS